MKAFRARGRDSVAVLLALTVAACMAGRALGQGWVELINYSLEDAPVYDVDGATRLARPAFLAQLYAAAPGNVLQPVGYPVPFLSGEMAGYLQPESIAVPDVPPAATALVQVVAWRASDGTTFAAANHLGGHVGESATLAIVLGCPGPPPGCQPSDLRGLQSFSLHVVVPEPSVFALSLRGGAVLALGRRWRRCRERTKLALSPP